MIPGIVAGQVLPASGGGGVAIEWRASVGTPEGAYASSHSVNIPAVESGDLLIMHASDAWAVDINTPSGWTAMAGDAATANLRSKVFYKITGSVSAATTNTVTTAASCQLGATVHCIKAGTFDESTPPERASYYASNHTGVPPSLEPSWGSAETLWVACEAVRNGYGVVGISTWPYADGQTSAVSGASGSSVTALWSCYTIKTTGTEHPPAYLFSTSPDGSVGETIAVRPSV